MKMPTTKFLATALALALCVTAAVPSRSRAEFNISVQEVGADVVVTGSGSANLSALTLVSRQSYDAIIFPSGPGLLVGAAGMQAADDYQSIFGPGSFGTGGFAMATSGSGQRFGLNALSPTQLLLNVPRDYVSGTALSSTSTYVGKTFASLGLTPGTYRYTWGTEATADSMTILVVARAVPEPASLSLALLGGLFWIGCGVRRRWARTTG